MARKRGSKNKQDKTPVEFGLPAQQRIDMLATILVDIISEELCSAK